MIGVELEGEAGEALNIAEGQTATITLPVPAALAASSSSVFLPTDANGDDMEQFHPFKSWQSGRSAWIS